MTKFYTLFLFAALSGIILLLWALTVLGGSFGTNRKNIDIHEKVQTSQDSFKIRAAIPYWDQENAFSSLKNNAELIDYISVFWYYLDSNGEIKKYRYASEDTSIISFAKKNGIKISAVITNLPEEGTWDSKRVKNVIEDIDKRARHIEEIRQLLIEQNFDGVTIDYESVESSQRGNFSNFVEKLSEVLHREGKYIEVALHPKKGEASDRRYDFQDWERLSKSADRIYIMAYDEHENESEPGPVAGFPWVSSIVSYARSQNLQLNKIFLGIPLDGYDWNTDSEEKARGLTFKDVEKLMIDSQISHADFDENLASPHFHYGDSHEVWFENARSITEKIKLAKDAGFSGVTFWRLGGEDPKVWDEVEKYR